MTGFQFRGENAPFYLAFYSLQDSLPSLFYLILPAWQAGPILLCPFAQGHTKAGLRLFPGVSESQRHALSTCPSFSRDSMQSSADQGSSGCSFRQEINY